MQKNDMTDFDLRMKSMLEDAREEVPAGVWDAVEARIATPKRVILTWRRAAAGFAAAAAIAAAFLIPSHNGSVNNVGTITADSRIENISVDNDNIPDISEQIQEGNLLFADVPSGSIKKKPVAESTMPSEVSAPQTFDTAAADEYDAVPGETQPALDKSENHVKNEPESWSDPFEGLEDEPAARTTAERFSFSLQGNLADNDKTSNPNSINRAPGSGAIVKTGVVDKSQSTYGVPVSFGIGARYSLNDRFALGTGINYSLLSRSFTGQYNEVDGAGMVTKSINTEIYNEIHYIGIPLNLYYDVIQSGNIDFYVYGGGSVEKGLANNYRIKCEPESFWYKESVPGLQWSVAAGLGLEFNLYRQLSLYLDPSVRYYFDCNQPTSVRTSRPYMFNFDIGLRFDLGR